MALDSFKDEFSKLLSEYPGGTITKEDLANNAERTNRHLRTAELVRSENMLSKYYKV